VKLRSGKELVLEEMTLLDLEDAEDEIGRPRSEWFPDGRAEVKVIVTLLWIAARGAGLTRDDKVAKRWPFTRRDLASWITQQDMMNLMPEIEAFFLETQGEAPGDSGSEPSGS
jgi:hypothetical protein